jgi:hypothetical protein
MQYCKSCKVKIITKTNTCPLCHQKIRMDKDAIETYPQYEPLKDKYTKSAKIISIIAPSLITISVILNLFVFSTSYWSVDVSVCAIYFWLLGLLTFNRRINLGIKLLAHAITIPLVLIVLNVFATSDKTTNNITWAISYATPLIILLFTIIISFMMTQREQKLRDYLLYQFALGLMSIIPLIIGALGLAEPIYPSIITVIYSYITIIYLWIKLNIITH